MFKVKYTILLFWFSLLLLCGCKSKDTKLVNDKINKAIEIGEVEPNMALEILDSIRDPENLDQENYMLYQIASVRAKRNADKNISTRQAELLSNAAMYFEKEGDLKNVILSNYYAGVAYEKNDDLEKSFTHYMKAYPQAKSIKDSLLIGKSLYNLGALYAKLQVYDSAYCYLKQAIPILKNYPQLQVQAYRIMAVNSYLKCDYEGALKHLNEGSSLLTNDKFNKYHFLYNILYGAIYKDTKKYKEASKYLRDNLDKNSSPTEKLRATLNLAEVYTLAQNKDSAAFYKQQAMPLLDNIDTENIENNYLLLFGYKVLLNYSIENNNKDDISKYVSLYLDKQKEIDGIKSAEQLFAFEKAINSQRIDDANRESKDRLFLFLFVVFITISSMALFIIFHRLKHRKTEQLKEKITGINLKRI